MNKQELEYLVDVLMDSKKKLEAEVDKLKRELKMQVTKEILNSGIR